MEILGKDAEAFCAHFDITAKGNWEGKNILRVDADRLLDENGTDRWSAAREKLLALRSLRVKPGAGRQAADGLERADDHGRRQSIRRHGY